MKQHDRIMDLEKETGLDEKRKKEEAERYEYERRNNPNRRNAAGQQPQPTARCCQRAIVFMKLMMKLIIVI